MQRRINLPKVQRRPWPRNMPQIPMDFGIDGRCFTIDSLIEESILDLSVNISDISEVSFKIKQVNRYSRYFNRLIML